MTERLYDADSYASVFEATVLSCKKDRENRCAAVLDRTLFFPEQGGQYADKGVLNGQAVLDVQIAGGEIVHYIEKPFSEGELVRGDKSILRNVSGGCRTIPGSIFYPVLCSADTDTGTWDFIWGTK